MNKEIWKSVNGFDNYEVSDKGRLRRLATNNTYKYPSLNNRDKDGYVKTSMNKNGKRHYLRMHRIVAENFIPNSENKPVVNHKNGIKYDNRLENLEWCTISENTLHGFKCLGRKGHNGNMNTPVIVLYDNGEVMNFNSQRLCSQYLNISEAVISKNSALSRRPRGKDYIIVRDYEGVTTNESVSELYCEIYEREEASRVD